MPLQNFEKIANLSLSDIKIGPVHQNILCISAFIYINDTLSLLVELNWVLLLQLRYTNTVETFLDKFLIEK